MDRLIHRLDNSCASAFIPARGGGRTYNRWPVRKPQRRSLYPWSQISSVVWRLPVIRVDLASQLPIYLRRFAIIAAGAALISSTWAQTPQGGAAPLAVARQAGKLALHQPV